MLPPRLRRWLVPGLFLALVAALLIGPGPAGAVTGSAEPVFINEVHYDNTGGDTGEFVEVAGPAGTDLSGWSLIGYNGNGGGEYSTTALSGIIDDEGSGYGARSFLIAGLQNGDPDGIALVDDADALVQFLSYEGSFAATDGPANGQTSTDIGISETSSTPIGESLQLTGGPGTTYDDFAWSGPSAASPGDLNSGQTVGTPPPADPPFISEIHYDNDGTDTGEFVEVEGPAGSDLTGWSLVAYNGNGGGEYSTTALSGTIDDEDGTSGAVSFPITGLQNGDPDGIALVDDADTVIEFLSYEGSFAATDGPANGQTSTDIGVSETSSTPAGESLQLIDGAWTGPAAESPGNLNGAPTGGGQPFPLVEDFTTDCVANGWEIVSVDADTAESWSCSTAFNNADVNAFGGSAPADDWLISPALDMEAQDDETLDFSSYTNFTDTGNYPALEVLWSADYDGGGDPTTATWTALTGITFSPEGSDTTTPSGTVDLTAISGGSVHFAFRYTSTGNGSGDSSNWRVSDITFGPVETGPVTPAKVHEVQGTGDSVAITSNVEIQAVVTSLFETDDALDGFFVQEEDADTDTDPNTSEAIFVFCGTTCPASLAVGDLVTVTGTPTEFLQMSQLDIRSGTLAVDGTAPLPAAVTTSLPSAGPTNAEDTFEAIEGMIVTIGEELFVSEYFELARFGEIVLTQGGVPYQFTDDNAPSASGYAAFLDDLSTKRIILDDDNSDQNDATFGPDADEAYPWPAGGLSITNFFRGGDSITGLTGVMHWARQGRAITDDGLELGWRIRPIQDEAFNYDFTANTSRPTTTPDVGGSLTVVSFNVLNYFNTLDGDAACTSAGCRGADSAAELARQRDKIVSALSELDADVVGLIEIENDADVSVAELVGALNSEVGAGTYDYVATGVIGGDAIKVAFIYKPATVTAVGPYAVLDSSVDPTFIDTKNRPVLIQTFEENAGGERFTAAINHLKSKGSACDDVGDPDLNDGQANCAGTRTSAATALANYLATDPTGSGDPDFLIMGDINAYAKEDPIVALETADYTNLIDAFVGDSAYSFLFDGQRGYLDHALANSSLLGQVSGAGEWNINADESSLLDYNDEVQDGAEASFERESGATTLYDTTAYRSSDHDPVIVGLNLSSGPSDEVYACGETAGTEAQLVTAGFNVIIGDDGDNFLRGTTGPDFILGLDGRDVILAGMGDDVICAGASHDTVVGGAGDDYIDAEAGNDKVWGGNDDDVLLGDAGMDEISGGNGDDEIDGGNANDSIFGGNQNDVIRGGSGSDDIRGNDGDDALFGDAGNDILRGHDGIDSCDGGINGGLGDQAFSCETVIGIP